MAEDVKRQSKLALKSGQFRVFTADTFGVRLSNHMAQIAFSLDTADEADRECLVLEGTVALSLPSFKVLTIILVNALTNLEKDLGPIALAPGKEDELRKILERAPVSAQPEKTQK